MADNILVLNDDCFLEIFQYLSMLDVANFKEIYKSRGAIADMEFSRKSRGVFCLDVGQKADEAFQITKQFGTCISHLAIICYRPIYQWSFIFSFISKHCAENLESLYLLGETVGLIKRADVSFIADVLKNIKTIRVGVYNSYTGANEFLAILSYCESARSIELYSPIEIDLPETIFQNNKNLLSLKMIGWTKYSDVKMIVDNLMNTQLEELVLKVKLSESDHDENLAEIFRLKHLKRLSIRSGYLGVNSSLRRLDASSLLRGVDAYLV